MVVADSKEAIERLVLYFGIVKKLECLTYEDITNTFTQYEQESLDEVCNNAPCGMACVKFMGNAYQWQVYTEDERWWLGTNGIFKGVK